MQYEGTPPSASTKPEGTTACRRRIVRASEWLRLRHRRRRHRRGGQFRTDAGRWQSQETCRRTTRGPATVDADRCRRLLGQHSPPSFRDTVQVLPVGLRLHPLHDHGGARPSSVRRPIRKRADHVDPRILLGRTSIHDLGTNQVRTAPTIHHGRVDPPRAGTSAPHMQAGGSCNAYKRPPLSRQRRPFYVFGWFRPTSVASGCRRRRGSLRRSCRSW